MEIQFKKKLNISGRTEIEIGQAIANLSRQNTHGQYDERIKAYTAMLNKCKSILKEKVVNYSTTFCETTAIMLFNKDRHFTITE